MGGAIKEKETETKLMRKREAQIASEFKTSQNSNSVLKEATKKLYQQVRGLKDEVVSRTEDEAVSRTKQQELKGEVERIREEKRELVARMKSMNSKLAKLEEMHKKVQGNPGGVSVEGEEGKRLQTLQYILRAKKEKLNCNICKEREKKVLLSKCLHMFCKQCIDRQMSARNRSCPLCKKKFDPNVD